MATVTVRRSDLFPVGQSVGVYPAGAERPGQPPTAAVIASAAVDAAGLLTVTDAGLLPYTTYVAYASVGGEHRYARCRSTLDGHVSAKVWRERVKDRRAAVGTTLPGTP